MRTIYLGPFRNELKKKQAELQKYLLQGRRAMEIAPKRKAIELMEADLAKGPSGFEYLFQPNPRTVGAPAFRWALNTELLALKMLIPSNRDPAGYARQAARFKAYADQLRSDVDRAYKFIHDTSRSREVWVVRRNLPTREVIQRIAGALEEYLHNHATDDNILYIWPQDALWKMLDEDRLDLQMMLRLATSLPNDIRVYTVETREEDPGLVALAELAVSTLIYAIPVIGNTVAAFEVWRGKDIWGNELSDVDRGILAASILLPLAARMVKAGRALYTSERMARLYGADARQWSYAMAMGEKVCADAVGLRRIKEADELVAAEKPIARTAAQKLAETFRSLGLDAAGRAVTPFTINARTEAALERVIAKNPKLASLDVHALERIIAPAISAISKVAGKDAHAIQEILARRWVLDRFKGQLLEELKEERIIGYLRDPYGRVALGLGNVKGSLYYIPGHLIRDKNARQLTDGIIIRFVKDRLHIVAVFEDKSGKKAARGLTSKFSDPTEADKLELLAEAQESIEVLEERARINGLPPPKTTVEEQMELIVESESRGQIGSDLERLAELKLWINGRELPVDVAVGPRSTKWFGVLPSDVDGAAIRKAFVDEAALDKAVNWNFEILGMDITQAELIKAAKDIIKEVATLAKP